MKITEILSYADVSKLQSLNKNLHEKKSILQFLPTSLEIISQQKFINWQTKKLKSDYLIDLIHNTLLKYYFKKENRFNLSSLILKEKYGYLYNYYISYLVENNILVLISKHKKGKSSRVYAIADNILRQDIKRYHNSDKVVLKKYKNKIQQFSSDVDNQLSLIDIDVKKKLVNDLFGVSIQFETSILFLKSLKNDDIDVYNRNRYSVECINEQHIFYHFDNYGRMHTNFTILKSFIRKNCLLIDGCATFEIDIKNSQPLFLSKLIIDSGTKWVSSDEFQLFRYLTLNGKYYEFMMSKFNINDKSTIKEMTYKVLFGRNNKNSKSDILFAQVFPTILNFIKLYKKQSGDYRSLSHYLQKAESNLIFNKIIKSIISINPEIKIITVHDSIIVADKFKDFVSTIFYTKLYEEFGLI